MHTADNQFKLMVDNLAKSIEAMLKENDKKVEKENFTVSHSIIACILLLAQQGMAF